MDFGTFIKNRRLELGLTLEQVGDKCGVSKTTVRKWELGIIQNIRRDKIAQLAAVLEIDPVDLIGSDMPETAPSSKTRGSADAADDDMDIWELREQLRRDPAMRTLFDLARRATPSDVRAAAAMLKALEDQSDE